MQYVPFGSTNVGISRIGLGAMGFGDPAWRSWVLPEEQAEPVIRRAIESGVNFVDTCDYYSAGASEAILGRSLWKYARRDEILLATKAGSPMAKDVNARGFSRKHLFAAIDASLKRLGTDHVDLFQTHVWDPATDVEEMVDAFDAIVKSGRALYVGAAQMPAWSFVKSVLLAQARGLSPFRSMQCEYNACHREAERELLPFCRDGGIAVIPFSPMARGFLCADRRKPEAVTERHRSDDYTRKHYHRDADYAVYDIIASIAAARGLSPAQVSLAYTLAQSGVTSPIIGPTSAVHVDEAVSALSVTLDETDIRRIEAGYLPRPMRGGGH